jgi:hypothetical protein
MSKLTLAIAVLLLSGCASMGEWRALSIDSTSESAFADSVTILDEGLSTTRKRMFRLALVDIARTGVQNGGLKDDGTPVYTDEDFRDDLDGLNYEGVIALADESGPSVSRQLYSMSWSPAFAESNNGLSPPARMPVGDDHLWPVSNAGLVLSDAWKEPGFSPSDFRYP